jgi:hypothetical protein
MRSKLRVWMAAATATFALTPALALRGEAPEPSGEGESLEYQVLASNSYSNTLEFVPLDRFPDMALDGRLQAPGLEKPERLVVQDADAWSSFWKRANPELAQHATKLAIDFSRDVVLVSAAGLKPTAQSVGVIVDVLEFPREIRVQVEETAGTCAGPAKPSHPLTAVRIARSAKPIAFDVRPIPCSAEE